MKGSNSNLCQWVGVNYNEDKGDDVELFLHSLAFNSNIWDGVWKLKVLKGLDMSNNFVLAPSKDVIKSCTRLIFMNLSSNVVLGFLPILSPL